MVGHRGTAPPPLTPTRARRAPIAEFSDEHCYRAKIPKTLVRAPAAGRRKDRESETGSSRVPWVAPAVFVVVVVSIYLIRQSSLSPLLLASRFLVSHDIQPAMESVGAADVGTSQSAAHQIAIRQKAEQSRISSIIVVHSRRSDRPSEDGGYVRLTSARLPAKTPFDKDAGSDVASVKI